MRREVLPDLLDPGVDTLLRKPRPVDAVEGRKGNSRSGIPTQVGVIVVQLLDRHAAPELGPPIQFASIAAAIPAEETSWLIALMLPTLGSEP